MSESHAALHIDLVWSAGVQPRKPIEPELFELLEAIRETGKLTSATTKVGLPYRQAWGLITKWSDIIGQPLVDKEQGRGSQLTPLGERLLMAARTDRGAAVAASRKRRVGSRAAAQQPIERAAADDLRLCQP